MEEETQIIPSLSWLTDDVITQILIKLPVKPLARLKAVCKHWRRLVSEPRFIHKHLKLSVKSDHTLRLLSKQLDSRIGYASIRALDDNNVASYEMVNLGTHATGCVRLRGSCNGLLLVDVAEEDFHLWNPLTREDRNLPSLPGVGEVEFGQSGVFGLGYDEVNEDYKVIFSFEIVTKHEIIMRYMIYSLRADMWREIEADIALDQPQHDFPLALNGALHWFSYREDNSRKWPWWYLVVFDVASEKFREIDLPNKLAEGFPVQRLSVDGLLGIMESKTEWRTYDFWVLNNYEDEGSWTLLYHIPSSQPIYFERFHTGFFWLSEKGVILVLQHFKLLLFDPKDCSVKEVCFVDHGIRSTLSFVESLVSPYRI